MPVVQVPVSKIRWECAGDVRSRVNDSAVARYLEISPENLPPVILYHDLDDDGEDRYWLAEGLHRMTAAWEKRHRFLNGPNSHNLTDFERENTLSTVWAEVLPGGRREALMHACGANARHGVPRSQADKRHVVSRLLADAIWSEQSDVWIAEQCKVSHTFVAKLRKNRTNSHAPSDGPRWGRDGKLRKLPIAKNDESAAPPASSRDVALAELAKSKAELDVAIKATEEAASLDSKLPTAKVLKALRAARREIVLWEKDLLDRPPEPPAPDPLDQSPEGRMRAQLYAINRMDSSELLGHMRTMMSHDQARLGKKGREARDEGRVGLEQNQPATKHDGRGVRDEGRVVRGRDNQPATKREEGFRIEDLGFRENQPATKQAGRATRVDFAQDISNLKSEISNPLLQPATKQDRREHGCEVLFASLPALSTRPATKHLAPQPATNQAGQPATKHVGHDPPPRSRDP